MRVQIGCRRQIVAVDLVRAGLILKDRVLWHQVKVMATEAMVGTVLADHPMAEVSAEAVEDLVVAVVSEAAEAVEE